MDMKDAQIYCVTLKISHGDSFSPSIAQVKHQGNPLAFLCYTELNPKYMYIVFLIVSRCAVWTVHAVIFGGLEVEGR